jgi:tetratricopeptide (TPR) repeat protein
MKKYRVIFLTGTVILMNVCNLFSQNTSINTSFSKSYQCENKSDYRGAIEALNPIYSKSSYEMNLRMGWLEYRAGSYKASEDYYQIAIALKPNAIEARLGYVYPAYSLGSINELIEQYSKILSIDPQNTIANYQMGMIAYNKKDYQVAYRYFDKVVTLYPFTYDALIMFAWSNYQIGKKEEATVLFNRVLCLSPDDKSALQGLSLIKK